VLVLGADAPGPCADGGWRACRQLSRRELALAIRSSAPEALFDAAGLRVEHVAWVSRGTPDERARELDALLAEASVDETPTTLRPTREEDEPIEIHAENPLEPWEPLVLVAGRARLSIAGLVEARD
jgi:hypothetical protein